MLIIKNSKQGSAYIYYRNEGGQDNWGEKAILKASDGTANDEFGLSVAVDGNIAIVGAPFADIDDSTPQDSGAVYIFYIDQGGLNNWGQVKKIMASNGAASDQLTMYGSISISGDYVIAGSWENDVLGSRAGAAYVYSRNLGGADNWGEMQILYSSTPDVDDYFGRSVAIDGNYLLVGSCQDDGSQPNTGAVHGFLRQGSSWVEVTSPPLTASDGAQDDRFGCRVALDNTHALIGSVFDDDKGNSSGSAYIYDNISDIGLPVELSYFKGRQTNMGVRLEWQTKTETDNSGFLLKRNGIEIASYLNSNELKGQGSKTSSSTYEFLDNTVNTGTYIYTLQSQDISGQLHDYQAFEAVVEVQDILKPAPMLYEYELEQNYPNPFNPSTTLFFSMKEAGMATIKVYDILGRQIKNMSVFAGKGANSVIFDGSELRSGVYFYALSVNRYTSQMRKMILIK